MQTEPEPDEELLPCKDKLSFDTEKEARATANVAYYRYGNKMNVYMCKHCGLWHLSSQ